MRPTVCGRVIDRVHTRTLECLDPWLVGAYDPPIEESSDAEGEEANSAGVGRWRTGWYFAPPGSCKNDEQNRTEARPVFVTGLENSGTSAVTAALRMHGVFMGEDNELNQMHEDTGFLTLSRCNPELGPARGKVRVGSGMEQLVADRTAAHEGGFWGFKAVYHGSAEESEYYDTLLKLLPNARMLMVIRDPFAVALRQGTPEDLGRGAAQLVVDEVDKYAAQNRKLLNYVTKISATHRVLVVSHEKVCVCACARVRVGLQSMT